MTARAGPARGLGSVLALLAAAYAAVVGLGDWPLAGPVRVLVIGLALIACMRVAGRRAARHASAVGVAVVCVAVTVVALVVDNQRVATVTSAVAVLILTAVAAASIALHVLHRPVADGQSIAGALAVYLLFVLLFAALHQGFAALLGGPYLKGITGYRDSAGILYFSVITASTVGFGDITPASAIARAVTMSEALLGQLYLVSIVGAVVGNWGNPTRSRQRAELEAAEGSSSSADDATTPSTMHAE